MTLFENVKAKKPMPYGKSMSVFDLLQQIANGDAGLIEHTKNVRSGKEKKGDSFCVTFAGRFDKRGKQGFTMYEPFLNFDIDKVGNIRNELKEKVAKDPHTFAVWDSISGNGITGLFVFEPDDKYIEDLDKAEVIHEERYAAMITYFKEVLDIEIDPSCKNIDRIRFLSHDPDIRINKDCNMFDWLPAKKTAKKPVMISAPISKMNGSVNYITDFNENNSVLDLLQSHGWTVVHSKGGKTRLTRPYGSKGEVHGEVFPDNRFKGYTTHEDLQEGTYSAFDVFMHYEWSGDFEAAKEAIKPEFTENYKPAEPRDVPPPTTEPEYLNGHHLDSPYIENLKLDELQGADVAGVLEGVPLIDAGIFDPSNTNSLPEPICEYLSSYEGRDRDLMLISLLGVLSGVFDNVKVKYHKTEVPTLYTMIITGAGSGKGYAERNNQLILGIDEKRREQSIEDQKLWAVAKEKAKNDKIVFTEPKPPLRKLWSSGTVTAAKLVQDLAKNSNLIISTTEAEGIATKMNSTHGSEMSEIFRKAYHQEAVTNETVKDGDQIAKNPLLSISILCTESQVSSIIQNVRDGLISRFSFYGFQDTFKFENPRQKAQNKDYQEKIDALKILVERLVETGHELIVDFTEHQDDIITEMGKALAEQVKAIPDQDTSQLCTRGMVQFVRICAILTNLRRLEDLSNGFHPIKGEVECSTRDFETAKEIWKPIISTNLKMFAAMSEVAEKTGNEVVKATESGGMFELIDFLPEEFTTKDAVSCGAVKEISKRSVTRYLKEWRKNGYIEQISRGKYRKSSKSENL